MQKRKVYACNERGKCGVMDGVSGESVEPMEEVPQKGLGESEISEVNKKITFHNPPLINTFSTLNNQLFAEVTLFSKVVYRQYYVRPIVILLDKPDKVLQNTDLILYLCESGKLAKYCSSSLLTLCQLYRHTFYRAMLCIRGTSHGPVSVSCLLYVYFWLGMAHCLY